MEPALVILNSQEQREALNIARCAIETYVKNNTIPCIKTVSLSLQKHYGAFVTIRKKSGELRGCVGEFEPNKPLHTVIQNMSILASTNDSRFDPITRNELNQLVIEISVMSPIRKITRWQDIIVGVHGVVIKNENITATYLPQVATENAMSLETFLESLCREKAGLSKDCYKNPDVELYIYDVQIISDS